MHYFSTHITLHCTFLLSWCLFYMYIFSCTSHISLHVKWFCYNHHFSHYTIHNFFLYPTLTTSLTPQVKLILYTLIYYVPIAVLQAPFSTNVILHSSTFILICHLICIYFPHIWHFFSQHISLTTITIILTT